MLFYFLLSGHFILQLMVKLEVGKMNRKSEIELTNMCLVYDESRVLVQEKVGIKYSGGLVFPDGHV